MIYLCGMTDKEIEIMANRYLQVQKELPPSTLNGFCIVRKWYISRYGDTPQEVIITKEKRLSQYDWVSKLIINTDYMCVFK